MAVTCISVKCSFLTTTLFTYSPTLALGVTLDQEITCAYHIHRLSLLHTSFILLLNNPKFISYRGNKCCVASNVGLHVLNPKLHDHFLTTSNLSKTLQLRADLNADIYVLF